MNRLITAIILIGSIPAIGGDLSSETTSAWEHYLGSVDARLKVRLAGEKPFLWMDEEPARVNRVHQGEVVVSSLGAHEWRAVPHGLIHDWIGAVFIPGVKVGDVLAVVRDFDRYKDFYKPAVVDSKSLDQFEQENNFEIIWVQKVLFVNAAIDARYRATYYPVDASRWYSLASSTRIQQIENYRQPDEKKLAADNGCGCLWRVYSIARFEERDGGVYVEVEAVALSRDIPASLRWMVAPVVSRISRNGVAISLRQTRDAVRLTADRVTSARLTAQQIQLRRTR
ncbi:MAG TPA: hypothetical protein VMG40_06155 [Bryobacteraceae bacterium]|nr:hypothetical protein [Bryobacteraceae bacterium]